MHTFVQVISGAGTPAARQGREMGVPSIVLNTWGPCWMVGITAKMKAREDTEEFHHRAFIESTPCILSSALNLCLDVSTSLSPLISCVSHEHLERSCPCTAQYRCSCFTFVLFPLSLSFFVTLSLQGFCRRDHHSEACNIFWKHDLAKQLHHVECTQYKTQHGVLAAHFAISVKTVSHDLLQDQYKWWKWPNPTNLKEPLL